MRYQIITALLLIPITGCGLVLFNSSDADISLDFNLSETATKIVASDEPVFSEESIFESISGMAGSHAATIVAFPDGELLAAWYSYPGDEELDGSRIYMSRKAVDATVWSEPQVHIDRNCGDGNPVLYCEGDDVWFFQGVVPFGWSTSHIDFQKSEDRGYTWSSPEVLNAELGSNTRFPPIRLSNGNLLFPAYDDLWKRSLFFSSDDDGQTWSNLSAVASNPGNLQPSVVQLSSGRLISVMRNEKKGCLWVMASDDEGETWSEPQDSGFLNPGSAAQIVRLADGNLILVFNDSDTSRKPLSIAISADEGKTWANKKVLANGENKYSYPTAIQSADGLIHIVYSLDRTTIRHITTNEAWIVSE
jgi:predicted neuraminidase